MPRKNHNSQEQAENTERCLGDLDDSFAIETVDHDARIGTQKKNGEELESRDDTDLERRVLRQYGQNKPVLSNALHPLGRSSQHIGDKPMPETPVLK